MGAPDYFVQGMDENFYEEALIERLRDSLGYTHLYGPDVTRSDENMRCSGPSSEDL